MDKSYRLRPSLAACLTLTVILTSMGAAHAGQVKEKDLSDVVASQNQPKSQPESNAPESAPASGAQAGAADDAKEGFSSGAQGMGHGFKNGAVATAHGFEWLGGKMGSGLKTTGTTMGRGFKTAGASVKNFFTGKYFGFGKKDPVAERDLNAEANAAGEADGDLQQIQKTSAEDDLEMDVDTKKPEKSDWAG